MSKQSSSRFYTLDGVRGVAALLVIIYHFGLTAGHMVPLGYLAVDLFFALSGFVIAWSYEDAIASAKIRFSSFMRMRMVRLYPLYLAGLLAGLIKDLAKASSFVDEGALSGMKLTVATLCGLFVLPSPLSTGQMFPINPPSWSLFIELLINVVFCLVFVRSANVMLGAVTIVSFSCLALIGATTPYHLDLGWSWSTLSGGFARVMVSFPLGMLMCRLTRGVKRRTSWIAIIPPVLLSIILSVAIPERYVAVQELTYVALAFPAILLLGILFDPPPELTGLFAFVGDISYPAYLLHTSIMFAFIWLMRKTLISPLSASLLFACGTTFAAAIAAHFYDRPVRTWLNRKLYARPSAPEQVL